MARFGGPLFVVGMPRSGTKLLRGLLNRHPEIGIPEAETEFLPVWVARWPALGDLARPERFRAFYEWTTRSSAYFHYLLEEHGRRVDWREWHAACRSFDVAGVFEALVRLDAAVPPGGVWGDKSPGYTARLPLLRHLFPGARLVHVVRDVRDAVLSIHRAWGKDPLRAAQRWADRVGRALDDAEAWGGDAIVVRYEDLLAGPERELRRVCALVERDFDPRMTELDRPTENLGAARGLAGIKRDNAGGWRRDMPPGLRRRVEAVAGPVLQRLGYPVDDPPPPRRLSPARMAAGQLHDGVRLVLWEARRRGPVEAVRLRWRIFRESGALERPW